MAIKRPSVLLGVACIFCLELEIFFIYAAAKPADAHAGFTRYDLLHPTLLAALEDGLRCLMHEGALSTALLRLFKRFVIMLHTNRPTKPKLLG